MYIISCLTYIFGIELHFSALKVDNEISKAMEIEAAATASKIYYSVMWINNHIFYHFVKNVRTSKESTESNKTRKRTKNPIKSLLCMWIYAPNAYFRRLFRFFDVTSRIRTMNDGAATTKRALKNATNATHGEYKWILEFLRKKTVRQFFLLSSCCSFGCRVCFKVECFDSFIYIFTKFKNLNDLCALYKFNYQ